MNLLEFKDSLNEDFISFIKGKRVKVLGNINSHNYGAVNTIFTVSDRVTYQSGGDTALFRATGLGNNINLIDLELVSCDEKTMNVQIDVLKNNIEENKKEIKNIEERIKFMKDLGLEEIDDEVLKLKKMVDVLESSKTAGEKLRAEI